MFFFVVVFVFVNAQWTLPNIILIRGIDMFIMYFCNINHCNDSVPCWDLD